MASHADMDDDDIYPGNDSYEPQESRMQDIDDEEEGEEVESDSDDDINFITDAKDEPKAAPDSQKSLRPGSQANERERASIRPSPTPTPAIKRELTPQANIHQISASQNDSRPGTDYPARHMSTLDPLNGNPIHSSTSKPILETDLDNDFPSESSKPWRKPGADMSDYFNYGFDEFTWASYCLKKQNMPKEIKQIGSEAEQLKAFMDGMPSSGMPGMPAMPTGPAQGLTAGSGAPDMPGMPGPAEMQQMMEFMKMQGMDPMQMDPSQMASMMMGMGGPGMQQPQQPPAGPAGFSGGHQDGFVGRGRGRRGGRW